MLPTRTTSNRITGLTTGDSSPFVLLDEMRREMDRVFDQMLGSWSDGTSTPRAGRATETWFPVMDVKESDRELRLTIEAPGLGPDDVHVDVTENVLTIWGEKKVERDEQDGAYRLVERRAGRFERRLTLPTYADADRVSAEYENGVLSVTIPKRADASTSRRVEIKSSAFQKLFGRGRKDADVQKRDAQGSHASSSERAHA